MPADHDVPIDPGSVGLPASVTACLFDLDGVLTSTATVHEAAWREMFDGWLAERARVQAEPFHPFGDADYSRYLDGRSRLDGIRAFLAGRGLSLPDGGPGDGPGAQTVTGLGLLKDAIVQRRLRQDGVAVYPDSATYLAAVQAAGLRCAVVSSSANTTAVLEVTGLAGRFGAQVDALVAQARQLRGKPAPDMFLAGAQALGATVDQAVVFEDAVAGVAAGRAGGFALVLGVDRTGGPATAHAQDLLDHGADRVVRALTELLPAVQR